MAMRSDMGAEVDTSLIPMTPAEVGQTLRDNAKHQAQVLAEERLPRAFEVLDEIMDDQNAPAGAKVSASKTIIEQASGRPGMQKTRTTDGQGLTINILELGGDGSAVKRGLEAAGQLFGKGFVKQLDAEEPFEADE